MSTLDQIRDGLAKAWDSFTEGWRELRELAGDALTRFNPMTSREDNGTGTEIVSRAARWGLLPAEVSYGQDAVRVTLEAPGLEPEDFDIEVVGDVLVVRGEKKFAREEKRGNYHLTERAYGRFERAIRLPAAVEDTGAKAKYRRGVLTVTLPVSRDARSQRISIESK